jgi:hypothetical protein
LTFNYNLEAVGDHKKICQCGAKTCSGFIGALKTEGKKTIMNKRKKVAKSRSLTKATAFESLKPIEFVQVVTEKEANKGSIQTTKRPHVTGDDFQ